MENFKSKVQQIAAVWIAAVWIAEPIYNQIVILFFFLS